VLLFDSAQYRSLESCCSTRPSPMGVTLGACECLAAKHPLSAIAHHSSTHEAPRNAWPFRVLQQARVTLRHFWKALAGRGCTASAATQAPAATGAPCRLPWQHRRHARCLHRPTHLGLRQASGWLTASIKWFFSKRSRKYETSCEILNVCMDECCDRSRDDAVKKTARPTGSLGSNEHTDLWGT